MSADRLDWLLAEEASEEAARLERAGEVEEVDRRLLAGLHPYQQAAANDPSRLIVLLCGGRAGKTTLIQRRFARRCNRTRNARTLYLTLTKGHAKELMWDPLKDMADEYRLLFHWNESDLIATLKRTGGQIKLVGADDRREADKLRGVPRHEIAIDESASFQPRDLAYILDKAIGPRIDDYLGTLLLAGTPVATGRRGMFYDLSRPGSEEARDYKDRDDPRYAGWEGWSAHRWNMFDAARYVPAIANACKGALVKKRLKGWTDDNPTWRTEYLGQWAREDTENVFKYRPHDESGAEFNMWDPPRLPTGFAQLPEGKEWRYLYLMDFGHRDPLALEVFAYTPGSRMLWHVYEFVRRGMYPRSIAELLLGRELNLAEPGGLFGATGWPDVFDADIFGAGQGQVDELKNSYGIQIRPVRHSQNGKHDAITTFNGHLIDGQIKILKGSELETQLMNLQWVVDDHGNLTLPKSERDDAMSAAILAPRSGLHLYEEAAEAPSKDPLPHTLESYQRSELPELPSFDDWMTEDANFD